jgi:exopolyphosphatase/guanosine-5'-triphosphate,3'-diphosphate pyrophosphatase
MAPPLASIDLGTNTVRLLIATEGENGLAPLLVKRRITRLGGGFTDASGISAAAQARTVAALEEFSSDLARYSVLRLRAVATSAVRDAVNGADFSAEVVARTGIALEVIGGEEEGLLTLRGVRAGLGAPDGLLLAFDVGGGSTEYTLADGGIPRFTRSLPLGVVRLTEGKPEPAAMADKVDRELAALAAEMARVSAIVDPTRCLLAGTAGTATTLAAIDLGMTEYDYRRVNGHWLARDTVADIFNRLLPLTPEERLVVPGMEKGREDLIIAGALVTLKTLDRFGFSGMKVSDFGLLEGVLLSIAEVTSPGFMS